MPKSYTGYYTGYYLVMYVGTFKKVGLSLIEKSITEELRGTMDEVGEMVWTLSVEVEYFEERTEKAYTGSK